jgi:hypothetical protein
MIARGGINPHFGQLISRDAPQSSQNKESFGFSNWHSGHFIFMPSIIV